MLKDRAWYRNQAGTRYIRDKPKPLPKRDKEPEVAKHLIPIMKEAKGDVELALLMAVRNLLADPKRWHPRYRAMGAEGTTEPTSPTARSWSLFGAVHRVTSPGLESFRRPTLLRIKKAIPKSDADSQSLMHWEPQQQHSKIVWVLNIAITACKKELGYN